jgi:hypothetical protein
MIDIFNETIKNNRENTEEHYVLYTMIFLENVPVPFELPLRIAELPEISVDCIELL